MTSTTNPAASVIEQLGINSDNIQQDPEGFRVLHIFKHHLDDEDAIAVMREYVEPDNCDDVRVQRLWFRFIPGGDGYYTGFYHEAKPGSRGATKVTEVSKWGYDYDRN